MENTIKQNIEKIKKGTYAHAKWVSKKVINGVEYMKISKGVIRLLSGVLTSQKQVEYVHFYLTHNANLKTKCEYFANQIKITKEEYDNSVESKNQPLDVCFSKHLCDILELSNKSIK